MLNFLPRKTLGPDLNAGLLVALVGIPQCLAYAMLSGLPPMYGLSTAIVAGLVAALFGRSAHVNVGPTNTTGLIVLAALLPFADHTGSLLPAMAALTILAGLWRLVIVLAKAERIFNFIPESVLLGFATGAAVTIGWLQLDDLLGTPQTGIRTALEQTLILFSQFDPDGVQPFSLLLGLATLVLVLAGRKFRPRMPVALLVLVLTTGVTLLLPPELQQRIYLLGDSAQIVNGWPDGALPRVPLSTWLELAIPALAIAMIGSLELIVTLRNHREMRWLPTELRAQGLANVVAGFASSFPASASLTRSALLRIGGARTRLAAITASMILVPVLFYGATVMQYIPLAVIAGLLLATAFTMLDQVAIRQLLVGHEQTRLLFAVTFLATLCIPFHFAILTGIGLSIALFLAQTSKPRLRWFRHTSGDHLVPFNTAVAPPDTHGHYYLQVSGSLYFAAAKGLPGQIMDELPADCQSLRIDFAHAHQLRMSAALALGELAEDLRAQHIRVHYGNVEHRFRTLLKKSGIHLPIQDWQLERRLIDPNS